jgi:hypothetical protein
MRSSNPVLSMVLPPWATNTSRELPDLPQLAGHGIADME